MQMRTCTLFIMVCCVCACYTAHAQKRPGKVHLYEEYPYSHVIKVNLLSPFVGTINIHYENKHNDNGSSQFELFYFTGQFFDQKIGAKGFGLTYNYRFYLTEHFPNGWYTQPFIRYQYYWAQNSVPIGSSVIRVSDDNMRTIGAGMVFGYQYILKQRVVFDFYAGPVYNKSYVNGQVTNAAYTGPLFNGGFVRAGVTMGVVF